MPGSNNISALNSAGAKLGGLTVWRGPRGGHFVMQGGTRRRVPSWSLPRSKVSSLPADVLSTILQSMSPRNATRAAGTSRAFSNAYRLNAKKPVNAAAGRIARAWKARLPGLRSMVAQASMLFKAALGRDYDGQQPIVWRRVQKLGWRPTSDREEPRRFRKMLESRKVPLPGAVYARAFVTRNMYEPIAMNIAICAPQGRRLLNSLNGAPSRAVRGSAGDPHMPAARALQLELDAAIREAFH